MTKAYLKKNFYNIYLKANESLIQERFLRKEKSIEKEMASLMNLEGIELIDL